jgi:glutamate dehydrogenase
MAADTGVTAEEVTRAFLVAREVSSAVSRWDDVERLDGVVDPVVQGELMDAVDSMMEQITRWYLLHVPELEVGAEIERSREPFAELAAHLESPAGGLWRIERLQQVEDWISQGVPDDVARCVAVTPGLIYGPDVIAVAGASGRSIPNVAEIFFGVGERLYLDSIEQRVDELPGTSRWQRLAWRTMVDDLRLLRRQIAERVIAQGDTLPPVEAVERYLHTRADPYQRLAKLMETISGEGIDDASVAMVAVHQIRQVVSA